MKWYRPEAERLQAEAMIQSGQIRIDDAIVRVGHAAKLAKDQGAAALEWRAITALARRLTQNGSPEQARERRRAICAASSEGLDSLELDEARKLFSTLS